MTRLIIYLLLLFIIAIFGYWIHENTSSITFDFFAYHIEASFIFAAFVLFFITLFLVYGAKLIFTLLSLPSIFRNYLESRRKDHLYADLQKMVLYAYSVNKPEFKDMANNIIKNKSSTAVLQKGFLQFITFVSNTSPPEAKDLGKLLKSMQPEVRAYIIGECIARDAISTDDLMNNVTSLTSPKSIKKAYAMLMDAAEYDFALKNFAHHKHHFAHQSEFDAEYQNLYLTAGTRSNNIDYFKKALSFPRPCDQTFALLLESQLTQSKSRFEKYLFNYFEKHSGPKSVATIAKYMESIKQNQTHELGLKLKSNYPKNRNAQILYVKSCLLSGFHNEAYSAISDIYAEFGGDPRIEILKAELAYRTQGSSSEIIEALKKAFIS